MKWVPLHCHSHFSLLDGLSKPKQIAKRCIELGYESCAITDHGSVSGAVAFSSALKGIKPILGCEFYISGLDASIQDKNNGLSNMSHLVVLAKNKQGWLDLIEANSEANDANIFYYKPRLDLNRLAKYAGRGNLISFSGHPGSDLANCIFSKRDAYAAKTYQEALSYVQPDAERSARMLADKYNDIFGSGNFFIEIQLVDKERMPAQIVIAEILRAVSKNRRIPCVATADSHYPTRKDAEDQRILLCSALRTTLKEVREALVNNEEIGMSGFFQSDSYHMPSQVEMEALHEGYEEELHNADCIAQMCDKYDITSKPLLPKFECPNGMSEDDYMTELCRKGWVKKIGNKFSDRYPKSIYVDRVKKELEVIKGAGLSGYFLVVQDYVNWARSKGYLVGPGRGSGAGCLVSYLLGITMIDPIPNDLLFERFYNAGRNTKDRVSLPDIDCDFPISRREEVIEYIKGKYGKDRVCQMVTFGRMQGRGALKEVLRVHDACSMAEQNLITQSLPHEHEISDHLEVMREADKAAGGDGEASIIQWVLENDPNTVKEWCRLEDNGKLSGPYAQYFEQAIRLEGTFKSQGKHAAGIVIASEPLNKVCPMLYDKNGTDKIAAFEMGALEATGQTKMDILGVAILDKLAGVNDLLENGYIRVSNFI